jgi:protein TonB
MWNETLIESMGTHTNGKRWFTVQLAAIVHASIVGVLVAGSFWYVDRVSLPAQDRIPVLVVEELPGGPPPRLGIQRSQQNKTSEIVKTESHSSPLVQEQIEPETIDNISDSKIAEAFANNLPSGDPEGVPGGDPNSNANGGFGEGEGNGLSPGLSEEPLDPEKVEVKLPIVIHQVKPEYPELLRKSRKEGIVILEAVISRTGTVKDVRILQSAHPLFAQSAIDAVLQWKYQAATLLGKPVAVYFKVTVSFKLR